MRIIIRDADTAEDLFLPHNEEIQIDTIEQFEELLCKSSEPLAFGLGLHKKGGVVSVRCAHGI